MQNLEQAEAKSHSAGLGAQPKAALQQSWQLPRFFTSRHWVGRSVSGLMLEALLSGRADIVYGSRYLGRGRHANQSLAAYLGGRSLSAVAWLFTGRYLTDTVTALKLFSRADLASLPLETTGFELDHEITARMLARGRRIVEVPIRYYPRSREEGKKIGPRDWFIGTRTFWKYRNG